MSRYCRNFNAVLLAKKEANFSLLIRARCKQWSCSLCAETNRSMWRGFLWRRVGEIGTEGWVFITVTSHKNAQKRALGAKMTVYSLKNIQNGTALLFKRLKRIFGDYAYVRVYEKHKSGAYHVHIIARVGALPERFFHQKVNGKRRISKTAPKRGKPGSWLPKTMIKNVCVECGMGNQADIQPIPDGNAGAVIGYIVKYMTKQAQGSDELKGVRRIQTSQHFGKNEPDESDLEWIVRVGIHEGDLAAGEIFDLNEKRNITIMDLNEAGYYPTYREGDEK